MQLERPLYPPSLGLNCCQGGFYLPNSQTWVALGRGWQDQLLWCTWIKRAECAWSVWHSTKPVRGTERENWVVVSLRGPQIMDFSQSDNCLTGPVPGKVHPYWIHWGKLPEESLFMWKYEPSTVVKVSKASRDLLCSRGTWSSHNPHLPWIPRSVTSDWNGFCLQQYLDCSYICISQASLTLLQFCLGAGTRVWHRFDTRRVHHCSSLFLGRETPGPFWGSVLNCSL